MNEDIAMAERIGQLVEENIKLKKDVKEFKTKAKLRRFYNTSTSIILSLGILIGLGWVSYKALNYKDNNYCYIETEKQTVDVFTVKRSIEWGVDREIGYATDMKSALKLAANQKCEVR